MPRARSDWTRPQPSPFASESLQRRSHESEGVEEGKQGKGGRGRDAAKSTATREEEVRRRQRSGVILGRSGGAFTCPGEEGPLSHPPVTSGRRGLPLHGRGRSARTMQLGLVALAMIFLSSMGHGDALKLSKARRLRRGELFPPLLPLGLIFFISFSLSVVLSNCRTAGSRLRCPTRCGWVSSKHLTSKVKITFCLFSRRSYLFFPIRHGKGVLKMCS